LINGINLSLGIDSKIHFYIQPLLEAISSTTFLTTSLDKLQDLFHSLTDVVFPSLHLSVNESFDLLDNEILSFYIFSHNLLLIVSIISLLLLVSSVENLANLLELPQLLFRFLSIIPLKKSSQIPKIKKMIERDGQIPFAMDYIKSNEFDLFPFPFCLTDNESTIILCNNLFLDFFQKSYEDLAGSKYIDDDHFTKRQLNNYEYMLVYPKEDLNLDELNKQLKHFQKQLASIQSFYVPAKFIGYPEVSLDFCVFSTLQFVPYLSSSLNSEYERTANNSSNSGKSKWTDLFNSLIINIQQKEKIIEVHLIWSSVTELKILFLHSNRILLVLRAMNIVLDIIRESTDLSNAIIGNVIYSTISAGSGGIIKYT
jgi:PAS domain-containing protein